MQTCLVQLGTRYSCQPEGRLLRTFERNLEGMIMSTLWIRATEELGGWAYLRIRERHERARKSRQGSRLGPIAQDQYALGIP